MADEQIKDRLIDIVNTALDDGDGPVAIVDKVLDCLAAVPVYEAWPEGKDVLPPPMAFNQAWPELLAYIKTRRDAPADPRS